nr:MAG TPA: hypothetical protein [Caudoviricetes sp.]
MKRTIEEIKNASGIKEVIEESKNIAWGGLVQEIVYDAEDNSISSILQVGNTWTYFDSGTIYTAANRSEITAEEIAEKIWEAIAY